MAEFEELKLQVSLVDEASAGLAKINEEIKNLGSGSGAAATERVKKTGNDIASMFGRWGQEAGKALGNTTALTRAMGPIGFAAGYLADQLKQVIVETKAFSDEIVALQHNAHAAGTTAAEFRTLSLQIQNFGVNANEAQAAIHGVASAMADLQKANSAIRNNLMGRSMGDEQARNMHALLEAVKNAPSVVEASNIIRRGIQDVYRFSIERGRTPQQAAQDQREFAQIMRASALIAADSPLKPPTEGELRREAERNVHLKRFNELWGQISKNLSDFNREMSGDTFAGIARVAIPMMERLVALTTDLADRWEKWGRGQAIEVPSMIIQHYLRMLGPLNPLLSPAGPTGPGRNAGSENNWPGFSAYPPLPRGGGAPNGGAMRAWGGGDFTEGWPESTNVEDRRNEQDHVKILGENTNELKRLNDWLMQNEANKIAVPGGAGGGAGSGGQGLFSGGGGGGGGLSGGTGTGGGGIGGGGGPGGGGGGPGGGGGGAGVTNPAADRDLAVAVGGAGGVGGPGGGGSGGAGAAGLRGSAGENAQRMYDTLRGLGHSHEQASAALAHARAESGFNPNVVGDRGTAFGMFQMRGERWANQQRMAREWGLDPRSPEANARFLDWELRNDPRNAGRGVGQAYFGARSTREAVTALNAYERFRGYQQGQPQRYRYGEQFANTMSPSGGAGGGVGAGAGATNPAGDRDLAQQLGLSDIGGGAGVGGDVGGGAGGAGGAAAGGGGQGAGRVAPPSGQMPRRLAGTMMMEGREYQYGAGGAGRGAIPPGSYPINIATQYGGRGQLGPVGRRIGSVATVGGLGGEVQHPGVGMRGGIQIHSGSSSQLDRLYSLGCFAISRAQWPAYRAHLLDLASRTPGGLRVDVDAAGQAQVVPRDAPRPGEEGQAGGGVPLPRARPGDADYAGGGGGDYAGGGDHPDRGSLDNAMGREVFANVRGDGEIRVDVNAPRGTNVAASGHGLFRRVAMNRQTQMEPAEQGPTGPAATAMEQ